MNDFYVYMYLRSHNSKHAMIGSPYYVGKGRAKRALNTNRHCPRPSDAANIIFISKGMSEPDAFQLEMLLIYIHGRIDNKTGYLRNFTDGGEGQHGTKWSAEIIEKRASKLRGRKYSSEHKAKLSAWQKGVPHSHEHVVKCADGHRGKKRSVESILKQIAAQTGIKRKPFSAEWRANISKAAKGIPKPKSEEHRKKLAIAQTGKRYSPESILKMVLSHTGKRHSEETKARMSRSHKIPAG